MIDVSNDPRIDPRIKTVLSALGTPGGGGDAESREQLLEEVNTDEAIAQRAMITTLLNAADNEEVAPSKGLNVTEHSVVSQPDGNTIKVRLIRPDGQDAAAVRVLHPRRRHADDVVLRRQLPRVGPHHRRPGRRRGDGRLPQRAHAVVAPRRWRRSPPV